MQFTELNFLKFLPFLAGNRGFERNIYIFHKIISNSQSWVKGISTKIIPVSYINLVKVIPSRG